MHRKTYLLATALLFPLLIFPASAADVVGALTTRIADNISKKDVGQFTIVNMTQNQIVAAQFGGTTTIKLSHPIDSGGTGQLDVALTTKPCGGTAIIVTFDDDTDLAGSVDLCTVRKLTIHDDTVAQ